MLDNGPNVDPALYSQVGWLKNGVGERHSFSEYTRNTSGDFRRVTYYPRPVGNMTHYEATWNDYAPGIEHWIDGFLAIVHGRVFTMRRAWNFGETNNHCAQMPGGTGAHLKFRLARVGNLSSDLYPFNGVGYNEIPAFYGWTNIDTTPDGYAMQIWDKACQS